MRHSPFANDAEYYIRESKLEEFRRRCNDDCHFLRTTPMRRVTEHYSWHRMFVEFSPIYFRLFGPKSERFVVHVKRVKQIRIEFEGTNVLV